jgi:anti-anti-sigma factor
MDDLLRLPARTLGHGMVVVDVIGEIDLVTAPSLGAAVDRILIPSPPSGLLVLLDLSRLAFCDVTGLREMLLAAHRLAERRARLALVAPRQRFIRLLEAANLRGYFEVFPSLRAAQAARTATPVHCGAA